MTARLIPAVFAALAALTLTAAPGANAQAQGHDQHGHAPAAKPAAAPTAKPAAAPAALPLVNGEVRKIDLIKSQLVLRHDDLPNIAMPAMTMAFDVADKKMLDGLKVGDKVRFQAAMVKSRATVTELQAAR
jgi:Cu(I)/Ag(I) efflux system membrane protein CusA/SilA